MLKLRILKSVSVDNKVMNKCNRLVRYKVNSIHYILYCANKNNLYALDRNIRNQNENIKFKDSFCRQRRII